MAILDNAIYVARADLFDRVGKHVQDWEAALTREAATATAITILGGYYNRDALIELCRLVPKKPLRCRKTCRIRIAVGLEGSSTLAAVWSEMRDVRDGLRSEGFRDVALGIISRDPVHFHTKLFGFVQDQGQVWYVGSANPGSKRHELMVRVKGAHRALTTYADLVFEQSLKVEEAQAAPNDPVSSLQNFFLAGVLCHKPPGQRLFTFDAFRFDSEHRSRLNQLFAEGARVSHAQTRTEGFGFGLAGALGSDTARAADDGPAGHVRYGESAVDTALGFWMPDCYCEELHARLGRSEKQREQRLARIASILDSETGRYQATTAFEEHVKSMTDFLTENGIDAQPIPAYAEQFERFLDRRRSMLGEEAGRRRHARLVILTPMPDIWNSDGRATRDFEESFFADVAYRAGPAGGNRGRIIRSLIAGTSGYGCLDTAEDGREALSTRLARLPWSRDDWRGRKSIR